MREKTIEIMCHLIQSGNRSPMTFFMSPENQHQIKLPGHQELQLDKVAIPGLFLFLSLFFKAQLALSELQMNHSYLDFFSAISPPCTLLCSRQLNELFFLIFITFFSPSQFFVSLSLYCFPKVIILHSKVHPLTNFSSQSLLVRLCPRFLKVIKLSNSLLFIMPQKKMPPPVRMTLSYLVLSLFFTGHQPLSLPLPQISLSRFTFH